MHLCDINQVQTIITITIMAEPKLLFATKIVTTGDLKIAQDTGFIPRHEIDEKFIHSSYPDQIDKVIEKFFQGKEVRLLRLKDKIPGFEKRSERNGPEGAEYPHWYGSGQIPISAVTHISEREPVTIKK
ncbi:MAG: hypothetical protein Hyperionvirus3_171 [Hyperionvirus sp.]|uniref:Uncharacterized protein n=1 Tax=Hyperionvirus sp. TaxID=2487770 RepID=A0A3G5A708_9VIRU|nr:MAG: hypothetical protein Hyperionvirus3_171 [Hyperionvirus sp.]